MTNAKNDLQRKVAEMEDRKRYEVETEYPMPLEPIDWQHIHIGLGCYIECKNPELECQVYFN